MQQCSVFHIGATSSNCMEKFWWRGLYSEARWESSQGRSQAWSGGVRQGDWPVIPRNRFCVGGWSLLVRCSHSHVEKEMWLGCSGKMARMEHPKSP
jgi:hypothetical protein